VELQFLLLSCSKLKELEKKIERGLELVDLRSFFEIESSGVARCDLTCWNAKVMNLTFKLKLTCLHGKSERVLTHCTLGVPLKCQAGVERLVATRSQTAFHTNMG